MFETHDSPNQALERTATRSPFTSCVTKIFSPSGGTRRQRPSRSLFSLDLCACLRWCSCLPHVHSRARQTHERGAERPRHIISNYPDHR